MLLIKSRVDKFFSEQDTKDCKGDMPFKHVHKQ